ncbi:MAG: hypothetical protein K6V97_06675 [Actinomycetia bacterium]|nr:hypothetical protein [Actinomycetes bacterium]
MAPRVAETKLLLWATLEQLETAKRRQAMWAFREKPTDPGAACVQIQVPLSAVEAFVPEAFGLVCLLRFDTEEEHGA